MLEWPQHSIPDLLVGRETIVDIGLFGKAGSANNRAVLGGMNRRVSHLVRVLRHVTGKERLDGSQDTVDDLKSHTDPDLVDDMGPKLLSKIGELLLGNQQGVRGFRVGHGGNVPMKMFTMELAMPFQLHPPQGVTSNSVVEQIVGVLDYSQVVTSSSERNSFEHAECCGGLGASSFVALVEGILGEGRIFVFQLRLRSQEPASTERSVPKRYTADQMYGRQATEDWVAAELLLLL